MKKIPAGICLLTLVCFITAHDANAQFWKKKKSKKAKTEQAYDYAQSFRFIDSLISMGQPKSAMEKSMEAKNRAHRENHTGYYIKAIDYQLILMRQLEEDPAPLSWQLLQSEIKTASQEARMFLYMDAAQFLRDLSWEYEENTDDDSSTNPSDWSDEKFNSEINGYISKSLDLAPVLSYHAGLEPLITNMDKPSFSLTLQQVMARKAISVLNGLSVSHDDNYKSPAKKDAFADAGTFLKADFRTAYDPRNEYRILRLYQLVLTNYHIYFDLERLQYVKGVFPQEREMFIKACENIINNHPGNPYTNLAALAIAESYQYNDKLKAMEVVEAALKRYPDFSQNARLEYIRQTILKPELGMEMEQVYNPQKRMLAKVSYSNIRKIFVKVYAIDQVEYLKNHGYYYNNAERAKFISWLTSNRQVTNYTIELPDFKDYKYHSSEVALQSLAKGNYLFMISDKEDVTDTTGVMHFNRISVADHIILKEKEKVSVVNAVNGHPTPGISYKVYKTGAWNEEKYQLIKTGTSDANGELEIPYDKWYYGECLVIAGNGEIVHSFYYYNSNDASETNDMLTCRVLTDRSIYRPGQVVYFKGIVYRNESKKTVAEQEITVILRDNNGDEKGYVVLKTNAYGSVSDSFMLPKGGFNNGSFSIVMMAGEQYLGEQYIQVEEYKRPKYTAAILPPEKAYRLNDHVIITGEAKALAGYPVSDAKVSYSVVRRLRPVYWYRDYKEPWYGNSPQQTLKSGDTTTDAEGKFVIDFDALPDESVDPKTNGYFIYEINATVTDINGETRMASYSMTMGYSDIDISVSGAGENVMSKPVEINFAVNNLQGKDLPFTGSVAIKKVVKQPVVQKDRLWQDTDTTIISGTDFETWFPDYKPLNTKEVLEPVSSKEFKNEKGRKWKVEGSVFKSPGEYVAVMTAKDGRGETVESRFYFHMNPTTPGVYELPEALNLNVVNGLAFEPGQTAKIFVGSGAPGVLVKLRAASERGTIFEKEITLNRSSQVIDIPVVEADRGDIIVSAHAVYAYRLWQAEARVSVPYTNKQLELTISSFRSDMEPGSREKWRVTLKGPKSEKAATEIAAGMYDQSLDELYSGPYWNHDIYGRFYAYSEIGTNINNINFISFRTKEIPWSYFLPFTFQEYKSAFLHYNGYMWDFGDAEGNGWGSGRGGGAGKGYAANIKFKNIVADYETRDMVAFEPAYTLTDESGISVSQKPISPAGTSPVRKNFKETAFFYPHLYANAKGEISLEFTMPEALTGWKLMMLAHSTTMQLGYTEQSVTTSKKVMVQPNMPRFLRQKDVISIPAKIVNTTKAAIKSNVSVNITDEGTGKQLEWFAEKHEKEISIPAGSATAVSFKLNIPDYTGIVTVSIYASSGNMSDGEQHTLAVLSNRTLITETLPITITRAGTQKLVLNNLGNNTSSSLTHEKLSVEMNSNPAWYAVQSLPYIMEYPYECAEQVFTRLYANSIAEHLANSDPNVRNVYEAWEKASKTGKGLQSKLMQNEDLKSTLISETPWLNDARNETERMRKLGLLFNKERMKEELELSFAKLKSKQSHSGGWSWFEGMEPNVYITQTIVIGFGKMKKMGVNVIEYEEMIANAMNFIDKAAEREYERLKKQELPVCYPADYQYVYCKSLFPYLGVGDTSRVLKYFITAAEKTWSKASLLNRAQVALALNSLKPSSDVPGLIMRSFDEHAKQTETMGMYWPINTGGWYWHEAPVETQASIIEAYSVLGKDKKQVKDQQVWLLRQKQVQSWGSTRSTADACYVLLMHGDLLKNGQEVRIKVADTDITPGKKEEGTGYFRADLPKENITSSSAHIDVSATTDDFAYGAAYWQYFEDIDKIRPAGSGLSIGKRIYKVTKSESGDRKSEIQAGDMLHVGDVVEVVLTVSSDRNLEFVHVKDQRASGTEPSDVISSYRWNNRIGYYQVTKDASTNFFIDNLPKGNYQLTYVLKVEQAGEFNSGLATAQCMYAPEYAAHSKGIIIKAE